MPGTPVTVPALVNDLDLEVLAPDGHIYHGNQFNAGESVADAAAFDGINNVEAVHLAAPVAGEYIVRVRARNVVMDARRDTPSVVDQDFALVVSGSFAAPGTGIVTFDRRVYTAPSTINLRLVDYDLAGQATASLLLRSTMETNGESITLARVWHKRPLHRHRRHRDRPGTHGRKVTGAALEHHHRRLSGRLARRPTPVHRTG